VRAFHHDLFGFQKNIRVKALRENETQISKKYKNKKCFYPSQVSAFAVRAIAFSAIEVHSYVLALTFCYFYRSDPISALIWFKPVCCASTTLHVLGAV